MTKVALLKNSAVLLILSAFAANSLRTHGVSQQGASNIEVRDESGKVRCRLGRIGVGYGLELFGEDATEHVVLSMDGAGFTFQGSTGTKGGCFTLEGGKGGTGLVIGRAEGWHTKLKVNQEGGLAIEHSLGNSDPVFAIRSDGTDSGRSTLEMRHPGKDATSSGLAFVADAQGVTFDLLRKGGSAVQMASVNNGISYLLLNEKESGACLQTDGHGNSFFVMSNKKPRVIMQSSSLGSGLAVDRQDGSSALRIGLDKEKDVVRHIWDDRGNQLKWDEK